MKPSFGLVLCSLFLVFIVHSIWNLLKLFQAPTCNVDDDCYFSVLNKKPKLDLLLYISDNSRQQEYKLIYKSQNFDYDQPQEKTLQIPIADRVRNNGSISIHIVAVPSVERKGKTSLSEVTQLNEATYLKGQLTKFTVPQSSTFNLLNERSGSRSVNPVTHLKTKYAIVMCTGHIEMPSNNVPSEIISLLRVSGHRKILPVLYQDFLQTRLRDLLEITDDMREANITFIYSPITIGKLRFLRQTEASLRQFLTLGFTEKDLDEVKGIFADTNVYFLCASVFIGSVHLLLDFLAFKNDVAFWKNNQSMAGLSSRSVLWRAFSQVVVFLYLLDEGTSYLVLIPAGIGTLIEFWKVAKVLKISVTWKGIVRRRDRKETKEETETRKYDEECMKYLTYLLYPLCIGSAIYSLLYQSHKSWYSWTISSLVNGVYAFGFIFMLPQLFINYRLKSVAALPWRAFTYKAFNTFIDDLFAFLITMPTAHRIACFRDDVVFLIYLYQRWLYPVDKSRKDDTVPMEGSNSEKKLK